MENKPSSVFEKLDKQEEKIDDISQKLKYVSINDLYALAKRTWDYGDFQTAQKYYNHISLLKPFDWEAPLYASLCNYKGLHEVDFWYYSLKSIEKIIISTIEYIYRLDLNDNEKENEINKCFDIIKPFLIKQKEQYFDNKNIFDDYKYALENKIYIIQLEEEFFNIYNSIKNINLNSIETFCIFLIDNYLEIIESTNKISLKISKDEFYNLKEKSSKSFNINYDELIKNQTITNSLKQQNNKKAQEIMLNGEMFFEYNDKVISKRNFIKKIIFASLILLLSMVEIVILASEKSKFIFISLYLFIFGLLLITEAILHKNKIKCSSFFCFSRKKNRLSSNGTIIKENQFTPLQWMNFLGIILIIISYFTFGIIKKYTLILWICNILLQTIFIIHNNINAINKFDGKYIYLYDNQFYE